MNDTPEELLPIVAELTDQYTKRESSSITYEKANQLMRAVIYCIEEYGKSCGEAALTVCNDSSASEIYLAGYQEVLKKTSAAGAQYSKLIMSFTDYGNRAYRETVIQGLPVFFRRYDARFAPQEHFLMLDYPVLATFGPACGIDLISAYLDCIVCEQSFLGKIPVSCVSDMLNRWRGDYAELLINIAGFTARNLLAAILIGKKNLPAPYSEAERERLRKIAAVESAESLEDRLHLILHRLISEQYHADAALFRYLSQDLHGFVLDLKNAAEHDCLEAVIAI